MLTQRADTGVNFTRRELVRLIIASVLLIVTLTATLAIDVAPSGLGLTVGAIAQESVRAPRAITYESAISTKRAKDLAAEGVPPQYDYSPERAASVAAQQGAAFSQSVAGADAAFNSTLSPVNRSDLLRSTLPGLTEATHSTLNTLSPERWQVVRQEAQRVLEELERSQLRDTDLTTQRQFLGSRIQAGLTTDERALAVELISPLVVANSSYSETLTQQARDAAAASVAPVTQTVQQGQIIVDAGHPITAQDLETIDALGINSSHLDAARLAGWFLLATLVVGLLLAWVWRFRPDLWHRNNVLLLVGLMLELATLAFKVSAGRSILPFFVPAAAVGMLVAILLDAGAATVLMVVIAVLAGAVNGSSLELTAYVLLGGLAGIVGVRRGDRLHVFVQAGLAVALINIAVVSTFVLLGERDLDLTGVLQLWGASLASGAGATVVAVGSFAALGNLFGILTVFQLLELANPSQSVLRRLLTQTPGTYHHSLMVGNLAERAAEAVGADPLLARTAAYYHDIGKLNNPAAFIENQAGGENIHDDLPPEVSAQILKAHVADGIDIAYRSRLPKALISFIPQHHGTALMSYFYAKAREEAAAPFGGLTTAEGARAADAVDARRFRHAGPKPQSREAAILMLADSVEASVRSLSSRDEGTIRAMVTRIIDERLKDGQFDECDLTLRDIEKIREAFVSQLLGMYHQRIAYPQNKVVELEFATRQRHRGVTARGDLPATTGEGRSRVFYRPPWRIDLIVRPDVRSLVPDAELSRVVARALDAAGAPSPASIGLILSDDSELSALNAEHMGESGPTDVLSFPLLVPEVFPDHPGRAPARGAAAPAFALPPSARRHLGDIVVSVERAVSQASVGRGGQTGDVAWSPADELRLLVTHGVLHICGWDHADPVEEQAMRSLESELLRRRSVQ